MTCFVSKPSIITLAELNISENTVGGEVVPAERGNWSGGHSSSTATRIYRASIRSSVGTAVATSAAVVVAKVGGRSIGKKGYSTW